MAFREGELVFWVWAGGRGGQHSLAVTSRVGCRNAETVYY
jgi:hypothetical protein